MYHVCQNQGQGPINHEIKSLDRFYVAMILCPTVILSGKHEFKIFQHCGYFSSDSAVEGLSVEEFVHTLVRPLSVTGSKFLR